MLANIVPLNIRNYTSNKFVSFGYHLVFNTLLTNIKTGQLIVEIDDDNYPWYKTTNTTQLKFGSISNSDNDQNISVNLRILNLYSFLTKIIFSHDIGFGESYVLGDFKVNNLKDLIKSLSDNKNRVFTIINEKIQSLVYSIYNISVNSTRNNIKSHYNISNEFYEIMLGKSMCYSSALFKSKDEPLYDAQIRKYHRLIEKAKITKDDHILEIGFGWATFLIEAVKLTGCKATGVTISEEQLKYSKKLIKKEGLDHLIDLQLCHYKDIKGKFNKIVSIEMMEHIGSENYGEFFKIIDQILEPDGIFVFQVITYRDKDYENNRMGKKVGFINKYIFLGGELPAVTTIINAATQYSTLELQDAESIGQHYSLTLDHWSENLISNQDKIKNELGFDQQFINMFEYYLNYCSAGFETKYISDFQMVYSRPLNTRNLKINYYND